MSGLLPCPHHNLKNHRVHTVVSSKKRVGLICLVGSKRHVSSKRRFSSKRRVSTIICEITVSIPCQIISRVRPHTCQISHTASNISYRIGIKTRVRSPVSDRVYRVQTVSIQVYRVHTVSDYTTCTGRPGRDGPDLNPTPAYPLRLRRRLSLSLLLSNSSRLRSTTRRLVDNSNFSTRHSRDNHVPYIRIAQKTGMPGSERWPPTHAAKVSPPSQLMPTAIAGTSQAANTRPGWTNQVKGAHGGIDGRLVARRDMARRRVKFFSHHHRGRRGHFGRGATTLD